MRAESDKLDRSGLFVDGLRTGELAEVVALAGGSARRLAEVGFVPGARLEMLRTGDPCIVRVDRARMGLGAGLQRDILIRAAV